MRIKWRSIAGTIRSGFRFDIERCVFVRPILSCADSLSISLSLRFGISRRALSPGISLSLSLSILLVLSFLSMVQVDKLMNFRRRALRRLLLLLRRSGRCKCREIHVGFASFLRGRRENKRGRERERTVRWSSMKSVVRGLDDKWAAGKLNFRCFSGWKCDFLSALCCVFGEQFIVDYLWKAFSRGNFLWVNIILSVIHHFYSRMIELWHNYLWNTICIVIVF